MYIAFYIFYILMLVVFIPGIVLFDSFWIPKEAIYTLMGFTLLGLSLIGGERYSRLRNVWLGALVIYVGIGFMWYFYRPLVFNAFNPEGKILWNFWNFRPTVNFLIGVFFIKVLVEHTEGKDILRTTKFLCWTGFLMAVYSLLQWLKLDQIFYSNFEWYHVNKIESRETYMVTFFNNGFLTANFLACISPLCLGFRQLRYKIFYLTMFIAVVLCNSTLSLVAFCLGLLVYLIFSRNHKLFILSLIGVCGLFWICGQKFYNFFSLTARPEVWKETIDHWIQKTISGHGLGNFAYNQFLIGEESRKHFKALSAHNEYLQGLNDFGIIGMVIVLGGLFCLLKEAVQSEKTALLIVYLSAFVTYLIICFGGFPLRIAPLAVLFIIYFSYLHLLIKRRVQ